jgi:hypothetical protein
VSETGFLLLRHYATGAWSGTRILPTWFPVSYLRSVTCSCDAVAVTCRTPTVVSFPWYWWVTSTTCPAFCTAISSYITRDLLLRTRIGCHTARYITSYSVYLFVENKFTRVKWLAVVFRHLNSIVAADSRVTCILNGYPCIWVGQRSLSFIKSF